MSFAELVYAHPVWTCVFMLTFSLCFIPTISWSKK